VKNLKQETLIDLEKVKDELYNVQVYLERAMKALSSLKKFEKPRSKHYRGYKWTKMRNGKGEWVYAVSEIGMRLKPKILANNGRYSDKSYNYVLYGDGRFIARYPKQQNRETTEQKIENYDSIDNSEN